MKAYSTTLYYQSPDLLDLLDTILTGAAVIGAMGLDLTVKIIRIDTNTSELDIEVISSDVTLLGKYKNYIDSNEKNSTFKTLFN